MNLHFQYHVQPAHVRSAYRQSQRWLWASPQVRGRMRWITIVFWLLCGLLGAWSVRIPNSDGQWAYLLAAVLVLIGAYQWAARRAITDLLADPTGSACGNRRLELEDDGLRIEYDGGSCRLRWGALKAVAAVDETLLLRLDSYAVLPIPFEAFVDAEQRERFVAEIEGHLDQPSLTSVSQDKVGFAPLSEADAIAGSDKGDGYLVGLYRNLGQGVRLAFFRPPAEAGLRVSWGQFVGLVVCGLALRSMIDLLRLGGHAEWTAYALPNAVFHVPVILLASWALAQVVGRSRQTLDLLIAVMAASIPIELLWIGAAAGFDLDGSSRLARRWGSVISFIPFLWLAFASAVAAVRLFLVERRRWLALGWLSALILVWPLAENEFARSLWRPLYDDAGENEYQRKHMALTGEDVFYLQPRLLERELNDISPGTPGQIDMFFVGIAGDASQDVFMKEVKTVRSLFEERFGTAGHGAALINNAQTVANGPIASTTALEQTLSRVGKVMNSDEDILFLFLTSHGSRQHRFLLDFWPMRFNQLDPQRLRQLLDGAGIKRRVVVVSACYSGGYIDALKDEHTLVMTSAAADKTSFGCSNEADMTEFGRALFSNALLKTESFIEAFEIAKKDVFDLETKDGREHSNPQIAVGAEARNALREWQEQRQRGLLARPAVDSPVASLGKPGSAAKFDEMLDLFEIEQRARRMASLCRQELASAGPERLVANQADYYGGLRPGSSYWTDILAAWARYEDETCRDSTDPLVLRDAYRKAWQSQLGERDVDAAIQWFRSPIGARWLTASNRAESIAADILSQRRSATYVPAISRLQADMATIVERFQRDKERRESKQGK